MVLYEKFLQRVLTRAMSNENIKFLHFPYHEEL